MSKELIRLDNCTMAFDNEIEDICYPKSNSRIYQEILEKNGAIISEYPPGTNPSAPLFPARNLSLIHI